MTIIKYQIFKMVTETMSFTNAAKQLNMTQSAVSRAILGFENDLGFQLFKRINNKVHLTPEGKLVLEKVNLILISQDQLIKCADQINNVETGVLKIGSFTSASSKFLPKIIKCFEKAYPAITLEVVEGDYRELQSWLYNGTIDIGFLVDHYLKEEFYTEPFFKDEMLVLVPQSYHFKGSHFKMTDIQNYPFIMPMGSCNNYLNRILNDEGITPQIKYYIELNSTVLSIVEEGLGISIFSASSLYKANYDFLTIPFEKSIFREIHLCSHSKVTASPLVKAFFEIARLLTF